MEASKSSWGSVLSTEVSKLWASGSSAQHGFANKKEVSVPPEAKKGEKLGFYGNVPS